MLYIQGKLTKTSKACIGVPPPPPAPPPPPPPLVIYMGKAPPLMRGANYILFAHLK